MADVGQKGQRNRHQVGPSRRPVVGRLGQHQPGGANKSCSKVRNHCDEAQLRQGSSNTSFTEDFWDDEQHTQMAFAR